MSGVPSATASLGSRPEERECQKKFQRQGIISSCLGSFPPLEPWPVVMNPWGCTASSRSSTQESKQLKVKLHLPADGLGLVPKITRMGSARVFVWNHMSLEICWGGEKGQPSWLFSFMAVWPQVALVPSGELWRMLVPDTQGQWAYYMKKYQKCLAQLMVSPKPSAQDTHTRSLMGLGGLWLPKGKCSPTPPCCALN